MSATAAQTIHKLYPVHIAIFFTSGCQACSISWHQNRVAGSKSAKKRRMFHIHKRPTLGGFQLTPTQCTWQSTNTWPAAAIQPLTEGNPPYTTEVINHRRAESASPAGMNDGTNPGWAPATREGLISTAGAFPQQVYI
jgi:hypothetical protein